MTAAGAAVVVIVVLLWSWAALWEEAPVARLVTVAACGALPAIGIVADRGIWPRLGLIAGWIVSILVIIGTATDVSIRSLARLQGSAWSTVRDLIDEGLSTAATVAIPLSGPDVRPITALLLIVVATTTSALVALVFVARRPIAGTVGLVIAVAYRWTLVPPENALRDGLIVVAAILVVLSLVRMGAPRRGRHPVRLVASGGAVLLIAALVSSGGWGKDAWWDWRNWSWGNGAAETLVVSPSQSYGPLDYPDDPVTIARVRTERPTSLRQVSLGAFDGISFTESRQVSRRDTTDGAFVPRGAGRTRGTRLAQQLEFTGLRSEWILTAGDVQLVEGIGARRVETFADGTLQVRPALPRGTSYRFDAVMPDPGIPALLAAREYAFGEVDDDDLRLEVGRGHESVAVPPFGTTGEEIDPGVFGPYADVYRLSREVIGDAASPYVAVNRLEDHLRDPSLYTYDTNVEGPGRGVPDLVHFLLESRTGYCQHFAGSLALMLRMNGIPARVAVGLNVNGSNYDIASGTYGITDRDVHSWVEVKLPGQGWLPFDPTPGRSAENTASVSSLSYQPPTADPDPTTEIAQAPVEPAPPAPTEDPASDPGPDPAPGAAPAEGTAWWLVVGGAGVLVLLSGIGAVPVAKAVRRRRRRRGDSRHRVLGAVREIESLMTDLGAPPETSATAVERATAARHDLGIDAERIYRLATGARFAPGPPTADDADVAWDDVDTIRRSLPWRTRVASDVRPHSLRRSPGRTDGRHRSSSRPGP